MTVEIACRDFLRARRTKMSDILQPWHLIILAVVAFLLFGAKRLPELGKGLGEGLRGFKEGVKGLTDETKEAVKSDAHTVTPQPKVDEAPKPPVA
jgi:sec-independent protein translocase protein TatA